MSRLTRILCVLCTTLTLAGCDKVAETLASKADEGQMRKEFVNSCAEAAVKSSGGQMNNDLAGNICGCTYDETAAQYTDREQWKKDLIQYGFSQNDTELERKLSTSMQACISRITRAQ